MTLLDLTLLSGSVHALQKRVRKPRVLRPVFYPYLTNGGERSKTDLERRLPCLVPMPGRHLKGALALTRPRTPLIQQMSDGVLFRLDAAVLGRADEQVGLGRQAASACRAASLRRDLRRGPADRHREAFPLARPTAPRHPLLAVRGDGVDSAARWEEPEPKARAVAPGTPARFASLEPLLARSEARSRSLWRCRSVPGWTLCMSGQLHLRRVLYQCQIQ